MEILSSLQALLSPEQPLSLELRDAPPDSASFLLNGRQAFSLLMGGEPTASGETVNEDTALKISWVFAAARVIYEAGATMPLRIYQSTENEQEATDHSLSYLLSIEPNSDMSAPVMAETIFGSLALNGNAYVEILRDGKKNVVGLYPLSPLQTEPHRNKNGQIEYHTFSGTTNGVARVIASKDMIHVPLFSWNGLKGLSPVQLQAQSLGFAQATLKQGARFIGNSFQTSGMAFPEGTLTKEQAQQLKDTLEKQATGNNQGRIVTVPVPMKFVQMGLSMVDAAFIESRNMSRSEIAAIFRLDPHQMGDTTRQSNSNSEQASLELIQDTLFPYMTKIAAEFNRKLLPMVARKRSNYEIRFDLHQRRQADYKTTLDALAVGRQWSIMTVDEARKKIGLNPVGGDLGNSMAAPTNMMNAEKWIDWTPIEKGTPTK